jgi:hypothetical protein
VASKPGGGNRSAVVSFAKNNIQINRNTSTDSDESQEHKKEITIETSSNLDTNLYDSHEKKKEGDGHHSKSGSATCTGHYTPKSLGKVKIKNYKIKKVLVFESEAYHEAHGHAHKHEHVDINTLTKE